MLLDTVIRLVGSKTGRKRDTQRDRFEKNQKEKNCRSQPQAQIMIHGKGVRACVWC